MWIRAFQQYSQLEWEWVREHANPFFSSLSIEWCVTWTFYAAFDVRKISLIICLSFAEHIESICFLLWTKFVDQNLIVTCTRHYFFVILALFFMFLIPILNDFMLFWNHIFNDFFFHWIRTHSHSKWIKWTNSGSSELNANSRNFAQAYNFIC